VDKRMAFMDDQHQIAKEKKQSWNGISIGGYSVTPLNN
jgi:hypothetical protein